MEIVIIKVKIILGLIILLAMPAQAQNWTISGNAVYVNDANVYISVSPHHIIGSNNITINLTSKSYTGNIDVILGLNQSDGIVLTSSSIWNGTAYVGLSNIFTKINYNFGGIDTWYYRQGVPVVAGINYSFRASLDIPKWMIGNGKYWVAIKPSSETVAQAITNGHFYYLDPWWNSSRPYMVSSGITNSNYTVITVNVINGTGVGNTTWAFSTVRSDCHAINTTYDNTTEIPYFLLNSSGNVCQLTVNISTVPAGKYVNIYSSLIDDGSASNLTTTFSGQIGNSTNMTLKAIWQLDESSGLTAADGSGNLYWAGTLASGSSRWVAGRFNNGLNVNGTCPSCVIDSQGVININATIANILNSDFAWTAWVKLNSTSTQGFIAKKGGSFDQPVEVFDLQNGKLRAWLQIGILSNNNYAYGNTLINDSKYHFIIMQRVKANNSVDIYVDSVKDGSVVIAAAADLVGTPTQFSIGSTYNGGSLYLNGTIDAVTFYNKSLTQSEISLLYNNTPFVTPAYPGRVLLYNYTNPVPTWTGWGAPLNYTVINVTSWGNNYTNNNSLAFSVVQNTNIQFNYTTNFTAEACSLKINGTLISSSCATTFSYNFSKVEVTSVNLTVTSNTYSNSDYKNWSVNVIAITSPSYNITGRIVDESSIGLNGSIVSCYGCHDTKYTLSNGTGYYNFSQMHDNFTAVLSVYSPDYLFNQSVVTVAGHDVTQNYILTNQQNINTKNLDFALLGFIFALAAIALIKKKKLSCTENEYEENEEI